MRILSIGILAATLYGCAIDKTSRDKVIYRADDRADVHEISDTELRANIDATAAIIPKFRIEKDAADGSYKLSEGYPNHGEQLDLCDDEKFLNQPVAAACSGVLVDSQTLLTAAHCVSEKYKDNLYVVFDYEMRPDRGPIQLEKVYTVTEIVSRKRDETKNIDYAVLKLSGSPNGITPVETVLPP